MNIEKILRWIVIAIVLIVAAALLSVLLEIGAFLLKTALKALFILLLIAIALRFFKYLQRERW